VGLQAAGAIRMVAGVAVAGVQQARVQGNEVSDVGPIGEVTGTTLAGLLLLGPYAQAEVSHNHVERDTLPGDQATRTEWHAILVDEPDANRIVTRAGDYTAVRLSETETLVINGKRAYVHSRAVNAAASAAAVAGGSNASVVGNVMVARGAAAAVRVAAGGDVIFAQNRCELRGSTATAVELAARAAIVNGNRVQNRGETSIQVADAKARVAAVGNVTSAAIRVGSAALPAPWADLNVNA